MKGATHTAKPAGDNARGLAGKKIFILDSSQVATSALRKDLEARQCQVEVASDSSAALMRLIRWHPDLLISGVEVGAIKGFDLCLILKLMSDYAGMPIILMSSSADESSQRKAAEAGADFYVPKDHDLVAHVLAVLNRVFQAGSPRPRSRREIQRVLLVDDSRMMRRVIGNILSSMGVATIVEADHGRAALEKLESAPVDLIITDWNMPHMNGLDFARAVRQELRWQEIPIIMVTTEGGRGELAEAKAAGINGHLCKPFNQESLRALISRFTE